MYENLWSRAVWIIFWVFSMVASAIFLSLSVLALVGLGLWRDNNYGYGYNSSFSEQSDMLSSGVYVVSGVFIGCCALTLIFNIVEIILFARKRLSPVTAVVLNSITTAIWLGVLVLVALAAVAGTNSAFFWIVIIVAFATSLGKLAYGSVILHRYRKRFSHRGGAYTSASAGVEPEFDSSPSGPYTAYNAGGAVPVPMRYVNATAGQPPSGTAGEYYDPESIRGYDLPVHQKATTRYA